jgi:hypothetical protein
VIWERSSAEVVADLWPDGFPSDSVDCRREAAGEDVKERRWLLGWDRQEVSPVLIAVVVDFLYFI